MGDFNDLLDYAEIDEEKRKIISGSFSKSGLKEHRLLVNKISDDSYSDLKFDYASKSEKASVSFDVDDVVCSESDFSESKESLGKVCPECHKIFENEIICPDCLIRLVFPEDLKSIKYLDLNPKFNFKGSFKVRSFSELLSVENLSKINESDFNIADFRNLLLRIRRTAFRRLNKAIKDNDIDLDDEYISDIVLLFTKAFVNVDYKSSGSELGYFEFNRIYIDDRQTESLQITTMLHELTHFLIKEIMTYILCFILDISKNEYVEAFIIYMLSDSALNQLIDEYAAHTVEARFTIFGYQDYSSFIRIQSQVPEEHVEIAKIIGNTLANYIKDIVEAFIDDELRSRIRDQFIEDTHYEPDFTQLRHETCKNLTDEGLIQALIMMLSEGFSGADEEILERYLSELKME